MDYEKKYKELINAVKMLKETNPSDEGIQNWAKENVPELADGEDELTWLTKYIEEEVYSLSMDIRDNEDRIKLEKLRKSLAWLEKQGEQKPTDKAEPKFKVGDWVIDKQGVVHQIANVVENVTNHTYGYDIGGGYFNDNADVRLWTIQDAKGGDVLCTTNNNIIIFKNITKHSVYCYCGLYFGKFDEAKSCVNGVLATELPYDYVPATKEQRDTLFAKMREAGYTWSEETHKLTKIELIKSESEEELSDFVSCYENKYDIPFDDETIRTTETKEGYVIVERYDGSNSFGHSFWKLVSINKNDSIAQKNRE